MNTVADLDNFIHFLSLLLLHSGSQVYWSLSQMSGGEEAWSACLLSVGGNPSTGRTCTSRQERCSVVKTTKLSHFLPLNLCDHRKVKDRDENFQAAKGLTKINRKVKWVKTNGKKTLSPQEVVYLNMNRLMLGDGMNLYLHPSVGLKTNFSFIFEGKTFCEHDVPNGS